MRPTIVWLLCVNAWGWGWGTLAGFLYALGSVVHLRQRNQLRASDGAKLMRIIAECWPKMHNPKFRAVFISNCVKHGADDGLDG